ncbi:MAG: hypothetical protein AABW99_02265 [archaeon]
MKPGKMQYFVFALIFASMFFAFYPHFWDVDYLGTIRTAHWLWEGKFLETDAQYAYYMWPTGNGTFVYPFEIGRTLISAPFTLISWNAPFVLGMLFHLLGFLFFYKILKLKNYDTRYSLIYLFYPSLTIVAHKFLLGEIASAALILAGAYFYLKEKKEKLFGNKLDKNQFIAGIFLGLSVWFRVTNAAIILAFLVGAQIKSWKNKGSLLDKIPLSLLIGIAISAAPSFIVTQLMIGTPWGYTYLAANEFNIQGGFKQDFDIFKMADYAIQYTLFLVAGIHPSMSRGLMLLFPLTLVALLKAKHLKIETLLATALVIMVFSFSAIVPDGRYFIPLMPLFLFAMVPFADKAIGFAEGKIGFINKQRAIYGVAIVFLVTTGLIFMVQSEKTQVKYDVSMQIYDSTKEGALLVDTKGGHTVSFLFEKFGDRRVEVMTAEQLFYKVRNTCWVKENGGLDNIYSSRITLFPRTEFSIQAFMKTDRLEADVKPLEEFMKENGITADMMTCK